MAGFFFIWAFTWFSKYRKIKKSGLIIFVFVSTLVSLSASIYTVFPFLVEKYRRLPELKNVVLTLPPGCPPISINTPIPGKYTNLRIRTINNSGTAGDFFNLQTNGSVALRLYIAPAGGMASNQYFSDLDGKTIYSCVSAKSTTLIFNGVFEIYNRREDK